MALEHIIDALRCPHCGAALARDGSTLRCAKAHAFDVARQGYVTLLSGETPHEGDTAAMLDARERFLGAGHYDPVISALAELCSEASPPPGGRVLELGAGSGHYLAAVLDRLGENRTGIAIDVSRAAAQRAARAHPRIGSVRADVWAGLPLFKGSVALALSVFGPRNPTELARILAAGGLFAVVTPQPGHLAELAVPLGLMGIEAGKDERLSEQLGAAFSMREQRELRLEMSLSHPAVFDLAAMGPNAHHHGEEELRSAIEGLPDPVPVTALLRLALHSRK